MLDYSTRLSFWIVLAALALTCAACSGSRTITKKGTPETPAVQAVKTHQLLAEAIADARHTGDGTINLYLDEKPNVIQVGDLAVLEGRALLDDRTVIWSSNSGEMGSTAPLNQTVGEPNTFSPEPVIAGERTTVPGLSSAIIGMSPGDRKTVTLAAAEAFGEVRPELFRRLPLKRSFPVELTLSRETFESRFGKAAVVGEPVAALPYVSSRVADIRDDGVHVVFSAKDGARFEESFGSVSIAVRHDGIEATLAPRVGSPFAIGKQQGVIASVGDRFFTVNLNHPLAGEAVTLELNIREIAKASRLGKTVIHWTDDFNDGMDRAAGEHKPAVLVLYAGWCSWSQKLLTESFTDPRVNYMSDRFVWMKIDSDKERGFKEIFAQESYPTVLVLDDAGDVLQRLDGYRTPLQLAKALERVLSDLEKT